MEALVGSEKRIRLIAEELTPAFQRVVLRSCC